MGMFQTAKLSVGLPLVSSEIGLGLVEASWAITVVSLTGALFGVQAGRISTEFGSVRILLFSLVLTALSGFVTALVSDPSVFMAARIIEGFGYLLVCAAAPPMMAAAATPRQRGAVLALWGAFVPVSVALMSLAGPPILEAFGWRVLFLLSAGTALALAGLLAVRADPEPLATPGAFGRRLARVGGSIRTDARILYGSLSSMGIAAAFMAFAGMQVGVIALYATFLVTDLAVPLATAGIILSVITPFAIPGALIAGGLQAIHAPDAPTGVIAFLTMAVSGGSMFLAGPDVTMQIVVGSIFFTSGGVVASVLFASLPKRATDARGVPLLSGLLVQFGNIGVLGGAPIMAAVAQGWGWRAVPFALAAMAAVGIGGVLASRQPG
jgi:MFS family permease